MRILVFIALLALGCSPSEPAATANACAGVGPAEASALSIASVERIHQTTLQSRSAPTERLVGIAVHVRSGPGVSAAQLTRTLRCSLAPDANVTETATLTDLVVSIKSDDPEVARVIVERGEQLVPR